MVFKQLFSDLSKPSEYYDFNDIKQMNKKVISMMYLKSYWKLSWLTYQSHIRGFIERLEELNARILKIKIYNDRINIKQTKAELR